MLALEVDTLGCWPQGRSGRRLVAAAAAVATLLQQWTKGGEGRVRSRDFARRNSRQQPQARQQQCRGAQ